jgi:hypothetical protein
MRRRSFVCLVASFIASSWFVTSAFTADGPKISGPVVHDNLAIYLVHGGSAAGGSVPLTLQEALAKGSVKVSETGSVNELTVENVGDDEVFVQAGDIVKGGRQDRVLSVDLLLPPRSGPLSIAAFCVEQGRWSARGGEDGRQFASAGSAMPSHEAKIAMQTYAAAAPPKAAPSPSRYMDRAAIASADTGANQQTIWKSVRSTQESLARSVGAPVVAQASPSSLQLSLESEKLKQAQTAYTSALEAAGEADADIVGYVFAINGKISSGDVYVSNGLFRKMWRKQLDASVTEAIGAKSDTAAVPPAIAEVAAFLASAQSGAKAERAVNANVMLTTLDRDASLYAEISRADGSWVHRNFLAK